MLSAAAQERRSYGGAVVDVGGVVQACRELTAEITDRPELAHTSHLLVRIGDRTVFDAHLIVTTGGLGPTADDLTAEVVGRFAGRELKLDEEMEAKIHAILEQFARRFSFDADALRDANRKQAMVPEGATAIDPAGTAPGTAPRYRPGSWIPRCCCFLVAPVVCNPERAALTPLSESTQRVPAQPQAGGCGLRYPESETYCGAWLCGVCGYGREYEVY